MMRSNYYYCIIILIVSFITTNLAANCYGPASKLSITEFDAFPSPVNPGEPVYIRANVAPGYEIKSGSVQVLVYYTSDASLKNVEPVVTIVGLDLCTLSSKVTCPIPAGNSIFEWQFQVPNILPGVYQVKYIIVEDNPPDGNAYSCIQFAITVNGKPTDSFRSWYQATLMGTALFDRDVYTDRQVGDRIQVGPAGPLNFTAAYGMIRDLSGSGDLVPNPYYDTSKFIWGMQGTLKSSIVGSKGKVVHVYSGTCYLGYSFPGSGYDTYDYKYPLITGHFNMTYVYTDSATAVISGYVVMDDQASIPHNWGYPLLYGRIPRHEIVTSNTGFLMIQGSDTYCAAESCQAAVGDKKPKGGLSGDKLGLAIGVPIAVIFVIVLITAALFWMKRRRETEQEDGVFAVARKPEYGSALVVDDIIEETRGSRTLQAMMDIQDDYSGSEGDDDSASASSRSRSRTPLTRSRSVSRSMTRSRSNSRSSRNGVRSGDYSDHGDSESRNSDSD